MVQTQQRYLLLLFQPVQPDLQDQLDPQDPRVLVALREAMVQMVVLDLRVPLDLLVLQVRQQGLIHLLLVAVL